MSTKGAPTGSGFKSSVGKGFCITTDDGTEYRLCDHVTVTAYCTEEGVKEKHAELEFWDRVSRMVQKIQITFDILHRHRPLIKELSSKGFAPPRSAGERELLTQLLSAAEPERRIHLVRTVGWHGADAYVTPGVTLVANKKDPSSLVFVSDGPPKVDFSVAGTHEEWVAHIAKPGSCSSRIITAVCGAFAAIALEVTGEESFALHFFSPSSTGKSSLLHVARSVAGFAGEKSLYDWNSTDIGFEQIAAASNCTVLITDESQLVDNQDATAVLTARRRAYQFVQGKTKTRSERYEREHKTGAKWSGVLLSAGEESITALAAGVNNPRKSGEVHRFIDIPAIANPERKDLGIFEKVPKGHQSSAVAADAIKDACGKYYGRPLRLFVRKWLAKPSSAATQFERRKSFFLHTVLGDGFGGVERRFCERFAVMYAAGCSASDWGIVPWSRKQIRVALKRCYRAARAVLNATLPQPALLADELRRRIEEVVAADAQGANSVIIQKAGARHPARILVRGSMLEKWFPVVANRDALLNYVETKGFLLRPPSRKARTVQVRMNGRAPRLLCVQQEAAQDKQRVHRLTLAMLQTIPAPVP